MLLLWLEALGSAKTKQSYQDNIVAILVELALVLDPSVVARAITMAVTPAMAQEINRQLQELIAAGTMDLGEHRDIRELSVVVHTWGRVSLAQRTW